jgi:hypothetical protein
MSRKAGGAAGHKEAGVASFISGESDRDGRVTQLGSQSPTSRAVGVLLYTNAHANGYTGSIVGSVCRSERTRDDDAQYVVGSLTDRHKRRIPIEAFNLELGAVAITAMNTHRGQRAADGRL